MTIVNEIALAYASFESSEYDAYEYCGIADAVAIAHESANDVLSGLLESHLQEYHYAERKLIDLLSTGVVLSGKTAKELLDAAKSLEE